jgi:hypothetical protein
MLVLSVLSVLIVGVVAMPVTVFRWTCAEFSAGFRRVPAALLLCYCRLCAAFLTFAIFLFRFSIWPHG